MKQNPGAISCNNGDRKVMGTQIITFCAAIVGAALGLMAPLVTTSLGRRQGRREIQRDIANRIIQLFETSDDLESILTSHESLIRRQLYTLALRLSDSNARVICLNLVSVAGKPNVDVAELNTAWSDAMNSVSSVYRGY